MTSCTKCGGSLVLDTVDKQFMKRSKNETGQD